MDHLSNCHGEWTFALQCMAALPLVGFWIRTLLVRFRAHQHHESHNEERR